MCDVCAGLLSLFDSHDERQHSSGGLQLNKSEILSVIQYVNIWPQRQCVCWYKDFKNFDRLNNIVQIILTVAIRLIQTLPEDYAKEKERLEKHEEDEDDADADSIQKLSTDKAKSDEEEEDIDESELWIMEEKDQLLQFVTKVFLMNFPSYVAYKHVVHSSLEELSQQETSALNNYCEISDPEVPLYLLRNVCFFCDSNGIQALQQCFEKATPDTLPFTVAHTLITIIANLRLWMNIATVMQCIVPLRTAVIRYMCKLSDKDLRMAGTRNMTDLMWAAVKEPLDTHFTYDKEGLDLAFKYFTCSTLTIRLAGIAQINRQVDLYNECCNNDTLVDAENVGNHLALWLLENKIIEHIFGPNLHVEIIKQSQIILNFLAVEGRVTNEHIDCIWAASQLKHCSKQVYDILIPLIKNLELQPVQHLVKLVSALEPSAHTESTLYLASALIKCIWNTCAASQSHVAAVHHQQPPDQPQTSYTALEQEDDEMRQGLSKAGKAEMSSSESLQVSEGDGEKLQDTRNVKAGSEAGSGVSPSGSQVGEGKNRSKVKQSRKKTKPHLTNQDQPQQFASNSDSSEESDFDENSGQKPSYRRQQVLKEGVSCDRGGSSGSESDIECSESSAGEGHGSVADQDVKCRGIKGSPVKCRPARPRNVQAYRESRQGTCSDEEDDDDEDDEEVEEEEEEMESEYADSDDDEIIKHAKLVHMKHSCHDESDDSSDFDASETNQAKLIHEAKLQYEAQQALQEQRAQHVSQQGLLKRAARLVLQRQGKQFYRVRPVHQRSADNSRMEQGLRPRDMPVGPAEDSDTGTLQCKDFNNSGDSEKKMNISDVGNLSQDSQDSRDSEAMPPTSVAHQDSADSSMQGLASSQSPQEFENRGEETEIFDCSNYIQHIQAHRRGHMQGDYIEDILSPDEGSCHSSRMSTKSEKNMADFDGEEVLSDEELAQINAHPHFNAHQMQQHLASMASMYHTHMPHVIHPRPSQKEVSASSCSDFTFDDVCKKGNTLLWDLVQDDTAHLLPEGLAVEAEKALCTLVCFSTDRRIKMKFIEACVENVALHRSLVVSLRLLPKIFSSFQQYRSGADTHAVTMWADKELNMMAHFFSDLIYYTEVYRSEHHKGVSLYSHKEEVHVRLLFLTCVFSSLGSPEGFRLNLEQVDTLWVCLASDPECSDECLSWFLNQTKSKDHHAMSLETFKYIFLEKLPQLKPESMSMIGLNLFQQLSHLARIANASFDNPLSEDQVCGMDQLWQIALRTLNTDVSITAIQFLNNYYINYGNGLLEKEEEFIRRCMDSLQTASRQLEETPNMNLLVIQRGLILLKNHLEGFRKRYAYHLRNWHIDLRGVVSHQRNLHEKQSSPIRILLQPAGISEKTPLDMLSTDLIAELRAEVARWWETLQKQQQMQRQQASGSHGNSMLSPILGAMLGDGPIRMITLGQELTVDMDEKTLSEMQFKDLQLVFVSVGASRPQRKMDGTLPSSCLPSPSPERLPMMILLQEPYFERLLTLLEQLSNLMFSSSFMGGCQENQERMNLQSKAKVFSRRVWELLMLLPTSPKMLDGFKSIMPTKSSPENIHKEEPVDWSRLLDPHRPHRLMYSLQIVEALSKNPRGRKKSMSRSGGGDSIDSVISEGMETPEEVWTRQFVVRGGLNHLVNIFKSGTLQAKGGETWNQWNQECLAYLLRLISQFSVDYSDAEAGHDDVFESYESPRKKMKRQKSSSDKIVIPRLNQTILSMLNVNTDLKIIMQILYDAAIPIESNPYSAGTWGRSEVVHYALNFLVSWAYSCEQLTNAFCSSSNFHSWLKRLTLEAPEPCVRKEVCTGLYRLCLGKTSDNKNGYGFLQPILSSMLTFLPDALLMKPQINEIDCQKEKEPYGPGCRDYFWLVCRFVDNISKEDSIQDTDNVVNLNDLAKKVSCHIVDRLFYETRHGYEEDDALIGLINLCTAIMKHSPPFKSSHNGQAFLQEVFWCLFALPCSGKRYLPKCKSQLSRSAAYDLLVEMVKGSAENYTILHAKVLKQHTKDSHAPYPWDYWPHEDGRSKCGYVGLTNLGATCYMATCMQHLYMIPQARQSVLQAKCSDQAKHEGTLIELQKMFAYLQESERKAYNPKSFCKAYTMDKQPLNTGEQKDMTEFFTDLITKLEEMSPDMKKLVKSLFGGVITNNVVSLDCPHVSRTLEEFYTVRCQVTDMKNLYDSLDEVTVKDMLEGDNMYTCSKCQKKVRAEKRACFKKLPKILCFNTMRYTFNMVTMMKEKVNTHFSFPLRLDMSHYVEKNLMGPDKLQDDEERPDIFLEENDDESYEYQLIGVTVHTGTADGGHYYSFIRDRINQSETGQDKWYLFNDAEVKPFDPSQIAAECFGGEMTSKTYDSVTDKFMDFSFEKTNSAYMLFYERFAMRKKDSPTVATVEEQQPPHQKFNFELSKELAEWIWQDNMQFLQDKNIFEHTYFGYMWQICGYIPTTLSREDPHTVPLMAAQLSTSFVLETLIHAKEKPTMLHWIELLTKQFNSCQAACEWFLEHMAGTDWWPQQILIKCPNQMVRQMFQRLLVHVITQLRSVHYDLYLQPLTESDDARIDTSEIGNRSCVTRFIRRMLSIIEHGVRPHSKYLTEYFAFLLEFSKMGDEECFFLIHINAISTIVSFYMGQKAQENYVEILSDDEEEDVIAMSEDKHRPLSLDKMIALIALLVERSRGDDNQLQLSEKDYNSIVGGKGFPFLFNQIKDHINVRQTCNLIFSLCRWNDTLALAIVQMLFSAVKKLNAEQAQPFFKLMSMLVEFIGGPPGMPPFMQYILQRFWELTECCPHQCLEWLSTQVTRNKIANAWVLNQVENWVEAYLIVHNNVRVRNAASYLLVSLVPSPHFRQAFRSARSILSPHKELTMPSDGIGVLHKIYEHLLTLLSRARMYVDPQTHGTTKLVCYFAVMTYCLISKTEKLMFVRYFADLWQLFQPKLSEPQISMHHNKQALLLFWYQVCVDCPENVKHIVTNTHVCKNIAFNYILADHDDQEVVMFNRCMLPAYYGLLRICCQQSKSFTRQLAQHQNIMWAFKNISPYPAQYTAAVEELFKMMRIMATKHPDFSEDEIKAVNNFKRSTIQMYLQHLDARSGWQTLINAFKILVDSTEDRLLIIYQHGLQVITEAFYTLHVMYHEATACHVTGDIVDLLSLLLPVLKVARHYLEKKNPATVNVKECLFSWSERAEFVRKLLTLLNSYTPPEIRHSSIEVLKEMILTFQRDIISTIVTILKDAHKAFQENNLPVSPGPYFPRRGQKPLCSKSNVRPPRPQFQMVLHSNQLEASRGVDDAYDTALSEFYLQYHVFVDLLCRVAVNQQNLTKDVINLSAMVAYEGVPLHSPYFAKLWNEIYHLEVDKNCIKVLCNSNYFIDYVDAVLLDERMSLNNQIIYQFFCNFFPKVHQQVLNDQGQSLLDSLVASVTAEKSAIENVKSDQELFTICQRINGDLRAMLLIFSVQPPKQPSSLLLDSLQHIHKVCCDYQQRQRADADDAHSPDQSNQASDREDSETPSKKRRISSEKEEDDDETNSCGEGTSTGGTTVAENRSDDNMRDHELKPNQNKESGSVSVRLMPREKPSLVDMVIKHIENLYGFLGRK